MATGIATVYLNFPLSLAVLHNAGAAVLVGLVTMLNYAIQKRAPSPTEDQQRHRMSTNP